NAIFIFTHRHSDHYSKKLLRRYEGRKYGPWNIKELETPGILDPVLSVKAMKTPHKVYGISFKHFSYLITWHNKNIYVSGDTGDLNHLRLIKNTAWAFVNPWLYMNALRSKVTIAAKNIGMYHLYPDQKINGK